MLQCRSGRGRGVRGVHWMPFPEDSGDGCGDGQVFLVGLLVKE